MKLYFILFLTILSLACGCSQKATKKASTTVVDPVTYPPTDSTTVSAFGELETSEYTPTIQIANKYNIDPLNLTETVYTYTTTGATVDNGGANLFRCQSGTTSTGAALIRSNQAYIYRAGEGVESRFTAQFTQGVANSLQYAGLFTASDMLAFGYDGVNFSAIHSYGGIAAVQTITINTAVAGGLNTCTVTLASVASPVTIAVTNTSTANNAAQIAAGLTANSGASKEWAFQAVNSVVFAVARTPGAKTTVSMTCNSSGTNTPASVVTGVAQTNDNTPRGSWNITTVPYAGFNPNNLTLYRISFGYLGVANIVYSVYNPETALFVPVHQVKWSGLNNAKTHLSNPNQYIGWGVTNTGNTTNLTVQGASASVGTQGKHVMSGLAYSFTSTRSTLASTANFTPLLSLQNRVVFGTKSNQSLIYPLVLSVDNLDATRLVNIDLRLNSTNLTSPNFSYQNEYNSIALVDSVATFPAATTPNGTLISGFILGPNANRTLSLSDLGLILNPGDTLTVTGISTTANAVALATQVTWSEDK